MRQNNRKAMQNNENNIVLRAWEMASQEKPFTNKGVRLRTCSAWVYESDNFYYLMSYNTIVAIIHKPTNTLYDVLRYVYGYTSTSAQHISKFYHDYPAYQRYVWKEV